MPDVDHPKSVIGKVFYFISAPLERHYGHRTVTHSFIGWAISSLIFAVIIIIPSLVIGNWTSDIWSLAPRWIAAFSISYMSHLLLDMLSPRGSQMFWPNPGRDVMPKNPKFRPESGSRVEILIFIILFALMLLAFPIFKYGVASSLRWLLATPGSAIQEFQSLKTHTYIDFKGCFTETKEPVEGKAEILDVDKQRLVILYKGDLYTMSDELAADITASHVRVKRTNAPIKIEHKTFNNESREYLLSQIPRNALVSGAVKLPASLDIEFPTYAGSFKPLEQKGDSLLLSFATKDQIAGLALTENFNLQKRKDLTNLSQLEAQAQKIRKQIREVESGGGLTPLGKKMLLSKEDIEKQQSQLTELKSQLDEINVKIEEIKIKMKARRFVFSGEVYLRQ
jgi:inner membrane protein